MPATAQQANSAVEAGRQRRVGAATGRTVRIEWFIENVSDKIRTRLRDRVLIATQLLKDRVVRNISTPVIKSIGPRGGRVITGRSKEFEYPHADTTQLMKTIFGEVREVFPGVFHGFVGTPLDYGLILETKMNRSFLVRSLNESLNDIKRILTGPIV